MVLIINLVKKATKGDEKAFLKLFQIYEQDIYRTAFIYLKNESDALDVVQETAYRSFKYIKNLKEPKYFKTWLLKIAINCAYDLLRKRKNAIKIKTEVVEFFSEAANEDVILTLTVRDLIEQLNEEEKSVIILRFYQDLTIKEISETLDIPLGTAKSVLYRALNKLRKDMKGHDVYER